MPPKKSKKTKSKNRNNTTRGLGDVTLNDYANCSAPKNTLRKPFTNVDILLKNEIEKSWDEKDLEDYEGDLVEQKNEDGSISYVIQKVQSRLGKKTLSASSDNNTKNQNLGNDYPIDIWYFISEHLAPEDVGRFAAICQSSYEVVCSSQFWFNLYRRYYKTVPNMPKFLQPESLVRKYGLKTNVVRALFYMYPQFVNRIKSITTYKEHPDSLKNRFCHLMWSTKKNGHWYYYFKMKKTLSNPVSQRRDRTNLPDLLEVLDDVTANPDNNCRVLEIACLHFIPVPPVIGLTLTSVSLTLSSAPMFHRLQMEFGSAYKPIGGAESTYIVLDSVINIKVLNWWHPRYPYSSKIQQLSQE